MEINGERLLVTDYEGKNFQIDKKILFTDCQSCNHFEEKEKITKSELAQILETSGDSILKIQFLKKRTLKEVKEILRNVTEEELRDDK